MNFNIYRNIPFRFDFKLGGFIRVTRRARTEKKQVKIAAKAAIWVLTFLLYAASFRYVMSCCARQIQIQTKIMRKIILSLGFVYMVKRLTNVPFTYISSLNLWFINHKFIAKDSSAFCLRNKNIILWLL